MDADRTPSAASPRAWLDKNNVPCFRADVSVEEASELHDMLGEAFDAGVLSGYEQAATAYRDSQGSNTRTADTRSAGASSEIGTEALSSPGAPADTSAAYTVRLWALRRLLGLAMIADGLTTFFTGWKIGVTLETAKKIGRLRSERILSRAD